MASRYISRALYPLIAFRWLLWAGAVATLIMNTGPLSGRSTLVTALVASTSMYTFVWSVRLPGLIRLAERRPLLLLADLVVSLLPAWLSGGWSSPFILYAYGALMLPSVLFRWRGTLVAVVAYIILDQIVGWTTWQAGTPIPLASPWGLLGYLRPLLAASIWPLGVDLWRWRAARITPRMPGHGGPARPSAPLANSLMRNVDAAPLARRADAGVAAPAAWGLSHPRPQTMERLPMVKLYASIQQVIAEAEDQGLCVKLVSRGPEPSLAQDRIHLLAKAVEVGLDNIRRHAHTREAEVTLVSADQQILLTVQDHGTGLLDGTAEPPGFHQLRRLRYRLQEIEGNLDVHEDESGGVIVNVRVPV